MDKNSFSYVIYMIHACAKNWENTPSEVYKKLKSADCIMGFLVPNYEILHTQSTQYVIEDIKEYLTVRGISI
ncbi:MAG: DUF3791 domain-containing protein [Lachnospiraceae bacterium]|nr:DUF3791 domain-containing protein [Lachnospiraceae bacterium]MDE6981279.1 DUF3791 domain-containing protein [Lachnospiraceae bacterium]